MRQKSTNSGFTLIELMIVVAIIAILAAIAIPAYFSYIQESAVQATRQNLETMRSYVEDFWMENGQYPNGTFNNAEINNAIDWDHETAGTQFNYTLVSTPAGYTAYAVHRTVASDDGDPIWVRCENNFRTCCASPDNPGGAPTDACP